MTSLTNIADFLAGAIVSINAGQKFVLMSKTHGNGLPLVAWRLKTQEHFDGRKFALTPASSPRCKTILTLTHGY